MKFEFEETQSLYESGSQKARAWTERWAADWLYCPNCGHGQMSPFPANWPVADLFCSSCSDQFELKSQKKPFGAKVADGAYGAKIERLKSATNPNLILLHYEVESRTVRNVSIVPKHFFVPDVIEIRKALAPTARRAGWVGSNILLSRIPEAGIIPIVHNGAALPRDQVLEQWRQTAFLREQSGEARGWLVEVMWAVEAIGRPEFTLDDVYVYETRLHEIYPSNNNVQPKIRQQLQVLRDNGFLDFVGRGRYRRAGRG